MCAYMWTANARTACAYAMSELGFYFLPVYVIVFKFLLGYSNRSDRSSSMRIICSSGKALKHLFRLKCIVWYSFLNWILLLSTLDKLYNNYIYIFFFSRKHFLTFHANCVHPMEIICMKCQNLFVLKNKKKNVNLSPAEPAQRVMVKCGIRAEISKLSNQRLSW